MKIYYSITTKTCPFCGCILARKDDIWKTLLYIATFPISIPIAIAHSILYDYIFKQPSIPKIGCPYIVCSYCNGKIDIPNRYYKNQLTEMQLLDYSFRWWFRLSYLLGGVAILSALGFIIELFDYDSSFLYLVLILIISIIIISLIVLRYNSSVQSVIQKRNSNSTSNQVENHHRNDDKDDCVKEENIIEYKNPKSKSLKIDPTEIYFNNTNFEDATTLCYNRYGIEELPVTKYYIKQLDKIFSTEYFNKLYELIDNDTQTDNDEHIITLFKSPFVNLVDLVSCSDDTEKMWLKVIFIERLIFLASENAKSSHNYGFVVFMDVCAPLIESLFIETLKYISENIVIEHDDNDSFSVSGEAADMFNCLYEVMDDEELFLTYDNGNLSDTWYSLLNGEL